DPSVPKSIASARRSPPWSSWSTAIDAERNNNNRNELADIIPLDQVPPTTYDDHTNKLDAPVCMRASPFSAQFRHMSQARPVR
ncbi:hypothetical protein SARC_10950, partial [Sphaeroforma arctica JP610]